jgi:hypothetical protein
MAFLKEDSVYTHIIAIDFGTGASGYDFNSDNFYLLGTVSHPG